MPEPIALTDKIADTTNQQQQQDGGADGSDQQENKPVRPDGFPDALAPYWNDDKGADYTKMGEDFAALSALKADHDARLAEVPDNPDEYEIALPEGFDIPEGMDFEALKDHPIAADVKAFAKEHGLTRDQFKGLIGIEAKRQIAEHKQLVDAAGAERTKLGTKAPQRIEAVSAWMQAMIGNELAGTLLPMIFSARQIEAYEKLMTVAKAAGPKITAVGRDNDRPTELTEEQWAAMSSTAKIEWGRKAKTA